MVGRHGRRPMQTCFCAYEGNFGEMLTNRLPVGDRSAHKCELEAVCNLKRASLRVLAAVKINEHLLMT